MKNDVWEFYRNNPVNAVENFLPLRDHQVFAMIDATVGCENTINSWCRRSGKNVMVAMIAAWHAIFRPYSSVVVYVRDMSMVQEMACLIREVVDSIAPLHNVSKCHNFIWQSAGELKIGNGSTIETISIHQSSRLETHVQRDVVLVNEVLGPMPSEVDERLRELVDRWEADGSRIHIFGTHAPIYPRFKNTKVTWRAFISAEDAIRLYKELGAKVFAEEYGH